MPSIITRTMSALMVSTSIGVGWLDAQIDRFPYYESFDSISVPNLPPGWTTSIEKSPLGDFSTSLASPRSAPNALVSSDATISQELTSPAFDLSSRAGDRLLFYERRSSSHNAGVLVGASLDGGDDFFTISDTLLNPGTLNYVLRSIALPEILNNRPDVRFRWRIIGNGTGKTATYRIDDVSLTVRAAVDLAVTAVRLSSSVQNVGDLVTVTATVKNLAESPASNFTVKFFLAAAEARGPSDGEGFDSLSVLDPLSPGDSLVMTSRPVAVSPALPKVFVLVEVEGDEVPANNSLWVTLNVGFPRSTVVINEILYAPSGPEPEWVELFNTTADSVSLKNWKLTDMSGNVPTLTAEEYFLRGYGYLVLADDASLLTTYPDLGPSLLVMNLPSLNNTGDAVVLYDHRGLTMDSLIYSPGWGGSGGTSLERVDPEGDSADPSNWGSSKDVSGSTPGRKNSLVPFEVDLAIQNVAQEPPLPLAGSPLTLIVTVRNVGYRPVNEFRIRLALDENGDGLAQEGEIFHSSAVARRLERGDSLEVFLSAGALRPGRTRAIIDVRTILDRNFENDTAVHVVRYRYAESSVIVNEIMFDPLPGGVEYVELFNRSAFDVSLEGWTVRDASGVPGSSHVIQIAFDAPLLTSGSYAVISSDSSLLEVYPSLRDDPPSVFVVFRGSGFTLNNQGDEVIVKDISGTTIDSVSFSPEWHNPEIGDGSGRSLERIQPGTGSNDSRNWSTCADRRGGTPGAPNSLFAPFILSEVKMSFSPNPFSPDGDGFEDFTILQYNLSVPTATIRVRVFDSTGRMVRVLSHGEPSGSRGEIIWDGLDDDRKRLRMGIYIVLLEAFDSLNANQETAKSVVVLARRL